MAPAVRVVAVTWYEMFRDVLNCIGTERFRKSDTFAPFPEVWLAMALDAFTQFIAPDRKLRVKATPSTVMTTLVVPVPAEKAAVVTNPMAASTPTPEKLRQVVLATAVSGILDVTLNGCSVPPTMAPPAVVSVREAAAHTAV